MAQGQPRVLDLTGSRTGPQVVVRASTAAEMLVSLIARGMTEASATFDQRPPELADDESGLPKSWAKSFESLAGGDASWVNLLALLPEGRRGGSAQDLMEAVEYATARQVWLAMAGAFVPPVASEVPAGLLERAADGDAAAIAAVRKAMRTLDKDNPGVDRMLALPAERLRQTVLDVLKPWVDEVFLPRGAATQEVLDRDAARVRALIDHEPPERVIELASRGLEFRPEAWIQRVVLLPHVSMRPWNVLGASGGDSLICYPVADESLGWEPGSPPPDLVRLHRALGDEKRLRILAVLAGTEQAGLQELADAVDLAKSSAHHHMVILRAAGLVAVTTDGRGRYRLRKDFIPEASAMLGRFLGTA
jgi:DNA-binding transcriptional ArsR family regulator